MASLIKIGIFSSFFMLATFVTTWACSIKGFGVKFKFERLSKVCANVLKANSISFFKVSCSVFVVRFNTSVLNWSSYYSPKPYLFFSKLRSFNELKVSLIKEGGAFIVLSSQASSKIRYLINFSKFSVNSFVISTSVLFPYLKSRCSSNSEFYGLCNDLTSPFICQDLSPIILDSIFSIYSSNFVFF